MRTLLLTLCILPAATFLGAVVTASPAAAQDFREPGVRARPEDGACIELAVIDTAPGDAEWTVLVGGGGGARNLSRGDEAGEGMLRLVGEMTVPLTNIGGPDYGGAVHLRAGPYVLAETAFDGGLGEGGVSLTIGQVRHARWGTFGIRFGGGMGARWHAEGQARRRAFVSATLSWGVLSVPGRHRERGACDEPRSGPRHLYASGFRIFATGRAPLHGVDGYSLIIGVEIEPGFLAGPFSIERLIGAR